MNTDNDKIEWSDGAQQGASCNDALAAVMGGDQPEKFETVEQMHARIRAAPIAAETYDGTATACARIILEAYEQWPELQALPAEARYLWLPNIEAPVRHVQLTLGLHDVLKDIYSDRPEVLAVLRNLTGFMWGWAVNAARRCLGLSEQPNPALLTVGK